MRWIVTGLAAAAVVLQFLASSTRGIGSILVIASAAGAAAVVQFWNDPTSKKRKPAKFSDQQKGQHRQSNLGSNRFTETIRRWRGMVTESLSGSRWIRRAVLALSTTTLAITLVGFPGSSLFWTMADDPQGLDGLPAVGSVPSTSSYGGQSIMDFPLKSGMPSETTFRESYPSVRYLNSQLMLLTVKGSSCSGSETAKYEVYSGTQEVYSGVISTSDSRDGMQNVVIGAHHFLRLKFSLLAPVGCSGTFSLFNPTLDKATGWVQRVANMPAPIGL
jgi:hypothetical protein